MATVVGHKTFKVLNIVKKAPEGVPPI